MAQGISHIREILAAARLEHVRYAIRDLTVFAEQLAQQGKEILLLNIGDPLKFDFQTPPHLIEAVARAMRDGKNGRSEEHTSELQSLAYLVCRLLLEKKKKTMRRPY